MFTRGNLIALVSLIFESQLVDAWFSSRAVPSRQMSSSFLQSSALSTPPGDGDDEDWLTYDDLEVLQGDGVDFDDEKDEDWTPDSEKYREKPKHLTPANEVIPQESDIRDKTSEPAGDKRPTPYTDEEEEIIEAMGGKLKAQRREDGFMGDCTLSEIAMDYSVPICYLADVLSMWGVPVPININDRLGDLVTGEQAFALVEAVNSLDIGAIQDRYSNQNLLQVCEYWDIPITDAFNFAMKEGWSLPFGVRTNLRVEQEDELLRLYSRI